MAISAIIAINAFTSGDIPPDFSVITWYFSKVLFTGGQYVWTSLCQFIIFFVNLLHSLFVWLFDIWHLFWTIWHLFDNLTFFWHFDFSFNLNHLSPSQGYFYLTKATFWEFLQFTVLAVCWAEKCWFLRCQKVHLFFQPPKFLEFWSINWHGCVLICKFMELFFFFFGCGVQAMAVRVFW